MISDPNPAEERYLAEDMPLCPACRLRPSRGTTPHTASGLKLCTVCASEGRRYGWD